MGYQQTGAQRRPLLPIPPNGLANNDLQAKITATGMTNWQKNPQLHVIRTVKQQRKEQNIFKKPKVTEAKRRKEKTATKK